MASGVIVIVVSTLNASLGTVRVNVLVNVLSSGPVALISPVFAATIVADVASASTAATVSAMGSAGPLMMLVASEPEVAAVPSVPVEDVSASVIASASASLPRRTVGP